MELRPQHAEILCEIINSLLTIPMIFILIYKTYNSFYSPIKFIYMSMVPSCLVWPRFLHSYYALLFDHSFHSYIIIEYIYTTIQPYKRLFYYNHHFDHQQYEYMYMFVIYTLLLCITINKFRNFNVNMFTRILLVLFLFIRVVYSSSGK